jgi:succinate-semialdehyde dehydrogenase/glutarate-semialdehyde dehydrogenase
MGLIALETRTDPRPPPDRVRTYAPATGALLADLAVTPPDEIRRVVGRARRAQQAWARVPVAERAERILKLRDALAERSDELVEAICLECGKPRQEALVHEVVGLLDASARNAPELLAPEERPLHLLKHRRSEVHLVPRGVVGILSPWNFPLIIPMEGAAQALLAGNACVVKPSEVTPLVMLKAKEIFDASGLPEDLLGVIIGRGAAGLALIEAGIDYCVFTGAVETGRKVAAACGAHLVPCTLELGGKAPLIACEDCDVERTARAIVFGGFANSGQACVSVERVYAHGAVHDQLLDRVAALTAELRQGDPASDAVDVGAMTFPAQVDVAERHVRDALEHGARLVCGGKRRPGPGQFFEPTVLAGCKSDMTVMREEIFGPIVPFMRVQSDDEAVALANDSRLGLSAYVFTRSRERGRRLAERIEAGSVVVNDVLSQYATAEAPFGGVKQSGFGRVHGPEALRAMCQPKHVSLDRVRPPARDPLWYPYTPGGLRWLRRGARLLFGKGGLGERIRGAL